MSRANTTGIAGDSSNAPLDAQFLLLSQRFGQLDDDVHSRLDTISSEVNQLATRIETWMTSRQPRLNVWIPSLAIVLGGFWFVLSLQQQSATKPLSDALSGLLVTTKSNTDNVSVLLQKGSEWTQQNASSLQDRTDQRMMLVKQGEVQTHILEAFAKADAERQANEREVETQIDAMNQSLSVQFANQQRTNADHQNALHEMGAKMPQAPGGPFYFPNISNRNHRKQ